MEHAAGAARSQLVRAIGHLSRTRGPVPPEPATSRTGFIIGWNLFRVLVWALILVWMDPRALDHVGGERVSRWLLSHAWIRWLGALPLALLALITAFEPISSKKRAGRQSLASELGGSLVKLRLDSALGIPDGPGLRVPVGSRSMILGTWRSKKKARTVATMHLETVSTFSFAARGPDSEPEMLQGLQQLAASRSLRPISDDADSRVAMAAAALAYLAEPPVATGVDSVDREILIRANQPGVARALVTAPLVVRAISALNAKTRQWDWTYYPGTEAGRMEMRLELPGTLEDSEIVSAVRDLLRAGLEELEQAGVIDRREA